MDTILLGIITGTGFMVLWIKALGFTRAIKYQLIGDILITGILVLLGMGTFQGVAMGCTAGLFVSCAFMILSAAV